MYIYEYINEYISHKLLQKKHQKGLTKKTGAMKVTKKSLPAGGPKTIPRKKLPPAAKKKTWGQESKKKI